MTRFALALAVVLAVSTSPRTWAGNYDGLLLGNNAAMSAGAVTATTTEATALWYNPAGLGGANLHTVDASGSAFILRFRPIKSMIFTELGAKDIQSDLENIELLSVGGALANAWRLSGCLTFALGVFQPEAEQFSFRAFDQADLTIGTPQDYRQEFSANSVTDRIHVGVGLGWQALDNLRVGVALFGIYRNTVSQINISAGATEPGNFENATGFGIANSSINLDHFGLQLTAGLQWSPIPEFHVGLTLKSPALLFGQIGEFNNTFGGAGIAGDLGGPEVSYEAQSIDLAATGASLALPFQVAVGLAYAFTGGWIGLDFDIRTPFYDAALDETSQLAWNFRFGFQKDIDKEWRVGAGVFSDHSATSTIDRVGEFDVDYYGLTFGVQTTNRLGLKLEGRPELTMTSTIAFRYAAGFGKAGTFNFDPLGTATSTVAAREVVFHEFTLHVGSTLAY